MQYAIRMTVKHVHDNQRAEPTTTYSESITPALNRADADRLVVALSQVEPSFGTRTSPFDTAYRTYETVGIAYVGSINGRRKIVLSIAELTYLAEEFTAPMQDATE